MRSTALAFASTSAPLVDSGLPSRMESPVHGTMVAIVTLAASAKIEINSGDT